MLDVEKPISAIAAAASNEEETEGVFVVGAICFAVTVGQSIEAEAVQKCQYGK